MKLHRLLQLNVKSVAMWLYSRKIDTLRNVIINMTSCMIMCDVISAKYVKL